MKEQSLTLRNLTTDVSEIDEAGYITMYARWDTRDPQGIRKSCKVGSIFHSDLSNQIDKLKDLTTAVQEIFETQCKVYDKEIL